LAVGSRWPSAKATAELTNHREHEGLQITNYKSPITNLFLICIHLRKSAAKWFAFLSLILFFQ